MDMKFNWCKYCVLQCIMQVIVKGINQLKICPYSFLEGAKTKSENFETFLMLPMSNFMPKYKKYLFSGSLHGEVTSLALLW